MTDRLLLILAALQLVPVVLSYGFVPKSKEIKRGVFWKIGSTNMIDEKNRKVALVTGASGGIGREIAEILLVKG